MVKVSSYYGNQLHSTLYSDTATDQPLLHQIMWDNRSCDAVSRPMKELSQHFTKLLDSYHDSKVSKMWDDVEICNNYDSQLL